MASAAYYNFRPNDVLYYAATGADIPKRGLCYQVEIKIFTQPDMDIETKLVYLISIDNDPNTIRVDESTLFKATSESPLTLAVPPTPPLWNTPYEFEPTENVWVIDRVNSAVRYGQVYQSELKIYTNSSFTAETKIFYYVSYSDNTGTIKAKSEEVFATSELAWAALGITVAPPVPAPTPTPAPTGPAGPSSNMILVSKMNTDAIVLYKGMPVYIKPDGTISRVKKDITALRFLGFVFDDSIPINGVGRIITEGTINNIAGNWNNIIEGGGSLMSGTVYYIGETLGTITAQPPTFGYSKQIGMATSDLEFDIRLMQTIKLS